MKLLLLFLFLFLFAIVFIIAISSCQNKTNSPDQLEPYTKKLIQLNQMLNSVISGSCITDMATYDDIKNKVKLIEENKDVKDIIDNKKASNDSIAKFNIAETNVNNNIDKYDKLVDCKDYCYQGQYSDGKCVCTSPNIPVSYNNKIYCYTQDCSNTPNMSFIPGNTTDPSSNSCQCNDGYVFDETKTYCIKKDSPDTEALKTIITEIQTNMDSITKSCSVCLSTNCQKYLHNINNDIKNGDDLIADVSDIEPDTLDAYNKIKTASQILVKSVTNIQCSDYCYQAKYNDATNICDCPEGYTKATQDGKTYCYLPCTDPNSIISFGNSKDPNSNQCVCKQGFDKCGKDKTICENCSTILDSETTGLGNLSSLLDKAIGSPVIQSAGPVNGKPLIMFPYSTSDSTTTKTTSSGNTVLDCFNKLPSFNNAFSFDPSTQTCYFENMKNFTHKADDKMTFGYTIVPS
jgi:hypothetical protein